MTRAKRVTAGRRWIIKDCSFPVQELALFKWHYVTGSKKMGMNLFRRMQLNLEFTAARCWRCQKLTGVQKAIIWSHVLEIHQVLLQTKTLLGQSQYWPRWTFHLTWHNCPYLESPLSTDFSLHCFSLNCIYNWTVKHLKFQGVKRAVCPSLSQHIWKFLLNW